MKFLNVALKFLIPALAEILPKKKPGSSGSLAAVNGAVILVIDGHEVIVMNPTLARQVGANLAAFAQMAESGMISALPGASLTAGEVIQ